MLITYYLCHFYLLKFAKNDDEKTMQTNWKTKAIELNILGKEIYPDLS